tara:strand:- start:169 stop:489 length:321 start_codon:yes stop_codon:yes gene_type:complete
MHWLRSGNWNNFADSDYINKLIKNHDAYVVYFKDDKMTSVIVNRGRTSNYENIRMSVRQFFGDMGHGLDTIAHLQENKHFIQGCHTCHDTTLLHLRAFEVHQELQL